jgi:hypothetical protein
VLLLMIKQFYPGSAFCIGSGVDVFQIPGTLEPFLRALKCL